MSDVELTTHSTSAEEQTMGGHLDEEADVLLATSDGIRRGRIELRYSLGDVCLFRVFFRAHINLEQFDPNSSPVKLKLPSHEFPQGLDVVVNFGAHVGEILPIIRVTQGGLFYVRNQRATYYIKLGSAFEEYVNEFSSKTRGSLQRKLRKVAAMASSTLECRVFRGPESASDFHRFAREIAVKTYQERLFDGAIPGTSEFIEKLRFRAEADTFRGYILFVRGHPVAYVYLTIDNKVIHYTYLGYDPEYAQWSPGTVLLYLTLEKSFEQQGLEYFDLGYGEGQMKQVFGREKFMRADIYFFRWSVPNVLAVAGHVFFNGCSTLVGRLLGVLGLLRGMRRILRSAPVKPGST